MVLTFPKIRLDSYKSNSQVIRILSENWVLNQICCPFCESKLEEFKNNKPVADFYCSECKEEFELKSKKSKTTNVKKIADGAYYAKIARLNADNNPNLFFMTYSNNLEVVNLVLVPRYYFTENIIEKRKPLADTARRAGWIGSNIVFSLVPDEGKIFIVKNGNEQHIDDVKTDISKTEFIKKKTISERGWIVDVLACVNRIEKIEFSLEDMYAFENELKKLHPNNNYVKDKIRQQLQTLRDNGIIEFMGRGKYKKKSN